MENKTKDNSKEKLEDVMKDLEYKINPKTTKEGIDLLVKAINTKDSNMIPRLLADGSAEFEKRVGRPMTYSEMRSMWG